MIKHIFYTALCIISAYCSEAQERSKPVRDIHGKLSLLSYLANLDGAADWTPATSDKPGSLECYFYCDTAFFKDSVRRKEKANALCSLLRFYVLEDSSFYYSKVKVNIIDSTIDMTFFSEIPFWNKRRAKIYKDKRLRMHLLRNALFLKARMFMQKRNIEVHLTIDKSQIVQFSIIGEKYAYSLKSVIYYLLFNGKRKRPVNIYFYAQHQELWQYSY